MKTSLGEQVEKVEVSNRPTDTPYVLVTSKFGWSVNMERIMKAQAMGDKSRADYMKGKKTMEINPSSPVIATLEKLKNRAPLRRRTPANCCSTPPFDVWFLHREAVRLREPRVQAHDSTSCRRIQVFRLGRRRQRDTRNRLNAAVKTF